jgi:hypothetical protein
MHWLVVSDTTIYILNKLSTGQFDMEMVKDIGKMENFVGCNNIKNKEQDTVWIHQPKSIKHLKEQFGDLVKHIKPHTTPASPKSIICRPQLRDVLILAADQTKYRSGNRLLLYLS